MTADTPSQLVPRLRFPEYRDAAGWSKKPLREFLTPIVRERKKPAVPYTGLGVRSHGRGTFQKEREHPEKTSMKRLYEVDCDDLIVNITFAWEGAIAIVRPEDAGALVSHRFPTYQFDQNAVLADFFRYPILDKQFIYNLGVISPGGAGRNRVLNKTDFLKIELALPEVAEQQKIADCLGSLDDLIAAEGRKLDVLRQHKQGLMQQLFPQVGETVPSMRFPAFRDAGDWEEKMIGDIANIKASGDLDVTCFSKSQSTDHRYPVYSNAVENAGLYGYYSLPKYQRNSVTITARGTLGVAFLRNHEFMGIGRLIVASDLRNLDPSFLKECWNHLAAIHSEVTSVPQLTAVTVRATVLPIPSPAEQQRIAACLSSLDGQIAAQACKLNGLRQHKLGLMQQVFPALEHQ